MGNIGIYLIQNKSKEKGYIGKSLELQKRIEAHKYKFVSGTEIENMQRDYDSGDEFCYEILFDIDSKNFDMKSLFVKQEISKIIDLLEAWYIIRFGTIVTGYNTKIGSFNDAEKAHMQCIGPDTALRLLHCVEFKKVGDREKFFIQMVINGLNILDITPEWLYLKLKNGEP